jgi:hypothetical protein
MRVLAAVALSSFVLSLAAPPADACRNRIRLTGNKAVKEVRRIEGQLRAGKHEAILGHHWYLLWEDEKLEARATYVIAVAAMRAGRDEMPATKWRNGVMMSGPHETPLRVLRELASDDKDNPLLAARIAEGLTRDPAEASATEAAILIEDLAARDVIPDAEAWVTLATVRSRAGDTDGSAAALVRCKKVARARKAMCVVAPALAAS